MVNKRAFLALMLAATLAGSASAALADDGSVARPGVKGPVATHHNDELSGPMSTLFFLGDRLLSIFGAVRGVGIVKLPTQGTVYQTHGIQDGPDGVDPLGVKEGRRTDGPTPANTPVP